MKRFVLCLLALLLSVCAFACAPAEPAATPTAEPTLAPTPEPTPEATVAPTSFQFQYTPPEGFFADSNNETLYYAPNYPTDSSNINMLVAASDTALAMKLYTSDMLKMTLDQSLSDAFNTTVAIEFDQFEYTEVAGQPALHMVFHYTVSEIDIVTAQYVINAGDSSCTLALAQMPGSEWLDAFDASVAALAIVPAE